MNTAAATFPGNLRHWSLPQTSQAGNTFFMEVWSAKSWWGGAGDLCDLLWDDSWHFQKKQIPYIEPRFFSGFQVIGIFAGDDNAAEPIKPLCYTVLCVRSWVLKITLMHYSLRVDVYANCRGMCLLGHPGLTTTTTTKYTDSFSPSKTASFGCSTQSI